jgi:type II secretory pathway pseudopilin PulG
MLVFEMKQKVRLSIDRSLSRSQRGGEESERLAFNLQPSRRAFTIIELVGVMAIVAIIAAALAPNIIKRIDRAAWQRETSDLNTMANGLLHTITTDRRVPNKTEVPAAIAKYLDLSLGQVTTTPRKFSRVFVPDPDTASTINGISGLNFASGGYIQNNNGSANRPRARLMIISTIARGFSAAQSNLLANVTTADFANVWSTPETTVPSWFTQPSVNWRGSAEDLCIRRVDLGALFHKLYLLNVDTNDGYFSMDANAQTYLSRGSPPVFIATTNYVIDGTALTLVAGGVPGPPQARVIIHEDESFVYQKNRWSRDLSSDQMGENLGEFGNLVRDFLNTGKPPYPDNWADPQAVIDQFYTYLWGYSVWAGANFQGIGQKDVQNGENLPLNPMYQVVDNAQKALETISASLIQ